MERALGPFLKQMLIKQEGSKKKVHFLWCKLVHSGVFWKKQKPEAVSSVTLPTCLFLQSVSSSLNNVFRATIVNISS